MSAKKEVLIDTLSSFFDPKNNFHQHLYQQFLQAKKQYQFSEIDEIALLIFVLDISSVKKITKNIKKLNLEKQQQELLQSAKLLAGPDQIDAAAAEKIELHDVQLSLLLDPKLIEYSGKLKTKDRYRTIVKTWAILNSNDFIDQAMKEKFAGKRLEMIKQLEMERDVLTDSIEAKTEKKDPGRGIETMFRTTSKSHLELSAMADNKANILLSISAILISLILSTLASKIDSNPKLLLPTIIILIVALITVIYATIATIPNVTSFDFKREDIESKKGNLLFFGNFSKMSLDDYEYGMKFLMSDRDYLYNSMIRDIYFLGKVLDKKYRNLKIAYNVFMYGLVCSTIAFVVSFL